MDVLKQRTGGNTYSQHGRVAEFRRVILCICTLLGYGTGLLFYCRISWAETMVASPQRDPLADQTTTMSFNAQFLHGQAIDLHLFSQGNPVPTGEYRVAVTLNNFPRGRWMINFVVEPGGDAFQAQPCFTRQRLDNIGIAMDNVETRRQDDQTRCQPLPQWIPGSQVFYDGSDFSLQLTVPQKYLAKSGRTHRHSNEWEQGVNALFIDYNTDIYAQGSKAHKQPGASQQRSLSLASLLGINLEGWRLRYRQLTRKDNYSAWQFQSQAAYAEHDVTALKSQLRIGETWTTGELFDSITFRGLQLRSDQRMLPAELRNYTPFFSAVAETNAKVTLWQHGELVQQLSVPPGPFEIDSPLVGGYGGDYSMIIEEADGRKRTIIVPNSAPPLILTKSVLKYELAAGRIAENIPLSQPTFMLANLFYGLSKNYTLYSGVQSANAYHGFALGNAVNTPLGGIALSINQSTAKLPKARVTGKKATVSFSKYLTASQTNLNFASDWSFSGEYLSLRQATLDRLQPYLGGNQRIKQRLSFSVGQPLSHNVNLNLTGSRYRYKNNEVINQYSVTLNKQFRYLSAGASLSRSYYKYGVNQNSIMFSISVPLTHLSAEPSIFDSFYSSISKNGAGNSVIQNNLSGTYGEENTLTYGVGIHNEKTRSQPLNSGVQGNMAYNSRLGQYSASISEMRNSRQYSLSAAGSLVAHAGGLTAGRQISTHPFAILSVPGAEGAKIVNGMGAKINGSGYGILPSLTPYQENKIAVNPEGLPMSISIEENEVTAVPRMGAAIKVSMKTKAGTPILLKITDVQGKSLHMMSVLYTASQPYLAIIGQGSRAFIQGWEPGQERLFVRKTPHNQVCEVEVNEQLINAFKRSADQLIYKEVVCQ